MNELAPRQGRIVTVTARRGENGAADLAGQPMPLDRALAIWRRYAEFDMVWRHAGQPPIVFGLDPYARGR